MGVTTLSKRLFMFLTVMGPGIVTAFADNDAGGIATYAAVGAQYGYDLLFVLLVSTISLAVFQEISARTGVVTGRGLAALIREHYGVCWSFVAMIILLFANIATTVSEFSGIASSFEILSVSKYVVVPLSAVLIWWLVLKCNYRSVEKVFFCLCLMFLSYISTGMIVEPNWQAAGEAMIFPGFSTNSEYILLAVGLVGTTITPWGQFYIQSSVVDKGIRADKYRYILVDVLVGTLLTGIIAFFVIIVTAAALYGNHFVIENVQDAAIALEPLAGEYAKLLFAFGLFGASMLAAVILPLSTAYAICEAMGFEHGIDKSYREAPIFFILYTFLIAIGAGLVLVPEISLYKVMLAAQVINGILLPPILIFMLLLVNNQELMGKYRNHKCYNYIAGSFTVLLILLNLILLVTTLI